MYNRVGFSTTNFYENVHELFYFGVFNHKVTKISFSDLVKKISPKSRLSLEWPRGDERSKMRLEACHSAYFTIIN